VWSDLRLLVNVVRSEMVSVGQSVIGVIRQALRRRFIRGLLLLGVLAGCGLLAWGVASAEAPFTVTISEYYQRYFSPNGDGQEDTVYVPYCLSAAANVDVMIVDGAGATVRTLDSGASRAANCSAWGMMPLR
jgi:hypothetical protein